MRSLPTRSTLLLAAGTALAGLTAAAAPAAGQAAPDVTVQRLAGADRYATAAAVVRGDCTQGGVVNIARGDAFPDALAAVNLEGPVLLTAAHTLPGPTVEALRTCGTGGVRILGTAAVVSARVEQQLRGVVSETDRVGGVDRYGTAARTYYDAYAFEQDRPNVVGGLRTGLLTSGQSFADAMTAGPLALAERLPLLLTARDSLPRATRDALLHHAGSARALQQVVVVGGPAAVSERVVRQVERLGLRVRRIAGPDRASTSVEVFRFAEREFGWRAHHVDVARGDAFADAVAAGPHAGVRHAPVLLTAGVDELGPVARAFLRERRALVREVDVLGDRTAVSDAVVDEIARTVNG